MVQTGLQNVRYQIFSVRFDCSELKEIILDEKNIISFIVRSIHLTLTDMRYSRDERERERVKRTREEKIERVEKVRE